MAAESILILDDEETLRYVLANVVEDMGYQPVAVGTVAQAVAEIAQRSFAVALLDLILPDGNGIHVLETIKQTSPRTEVVVLTGHASIETAVGAVRAGAYDYIEKPFEIPAVAALVGRAIEKRALMVKNDLLVSDLERQNGQLAATVRRAKSLTAAGNAMGQMRDLPDLLTFFIHLVVEELEVDRASVMLVEGSGELRIVASHGIEPEIVERTRARVGEGIVGRVVESGTSILASDLRRDRGIL